MARQIGQGIDQYVGFITGYRLLCVQVIHTTVNTDLLQAKHGVAGKSTTERANWSRNGVFSGSSSRVSTTS
jgi:hypothetical protein